MPRLFPVFPYPRSVPFCRYTFLFPVPAHLFKLFSFILPRIFRKRDARHIFTVTHTDVLPRLFPVFPYPRSVPFCRYIFLFPVPAHLFKLFSFILPRIFRKRDALTYFHGHAYRCFAAPFPVFPYPRSVPFCRYIFLSPVFRPTDIEYRATEKRVFRHFRPDTRFYIFMMLRLFISFKATAVGLPV